MKGWLFLMKKIIMFALIILIVVINRNINIIPEESIRFRIIPNSNSYVDILMKEKVIDRISKHFVDFDNITETRNNILNSKDAISKEVKELFKENEYNMEYSIKFGQNYFPKKEYEGIVYPEGNYESLLIKIGEGKGDNFWCVLYPPLCMVEEKTEKKYSLKIKELFVKLFD